MDERYEWMDTILTEYAEWLAHEQDMESNPFGDCPPTDEEMETMYHEMVEG